MINKKLAMVMMSSMGIWLSACHSSDDDQTHVVEQPQPQFVAVDHLKISDLNHIALANAEIKILSEQEWQDLQNQQLKTQAFSANLAMSTDVDQTIFLQNTLWPTDASFLGQTYYANAFGQVEGLNLMAGTYYIWVNKNGISSINALVVHALNQLNTLIFMSNLSCKSQDCLQISQEKNAIVGGLSGQVLAQGKPLVNAQVSLSAGAATNGAFVTALTDDNGYFNLAFNVSSALKESLKQATLMVSANGYSSLSKKVWVTGSVSAGHQFVLEPIEASTQIWHETFESDSTTRDLWTTWSSSNDVAWHRLNTTDHIVNQDVNRLVLLAPNDQSDAKIPTALQAQEAYWYGNKSRGNFLGESTDEHLGGGRSIRKNAGQLTSPVIDLTYTQVPLSLTFKTWWEIESVNPNQNGYDLMDIEVAVEGGDFKQLARLNPLSDPQTSYTRNPIPFSNAGYNLAPMALQQEAISLDQYVGKKIQLRFHFNTNDELYNAFRGWMIDDLLIQNTQGTFPLLNQGQDDLDESTSPPSDGVMPTLFAVKAKQMLQSTPTQRWLNTPKRS